MHLLASHIRVTDKYIECDNHANQYSMFLLNYIKFGPNITQKPYSMYLSYIFTISPFKRGLQIPYFLSATLLCLTGPRGRACVLAAKLIGVRHNMYVGHFFRGATYHPGSCVEAVVEVVVEVVRGCVEVVVVPCGSCCGSCFC